MEPRPATSQDYPENQPSVWKIGSKGGLYTGLVFILWGLIIYLTGLYANSLLNTLFSLIAYVIGIYLTHKAFKEQGNGFMSYGQGLGVGTVLGLVSGLIYGAFVVLYIFMIDPTIPERQLEEAIIKMEDAGYTDEQIEQSMAFTDIFSSPLAIFAAQAFSGLFFAFLLALVVSAFTKNTDPTAEY